MYLFLQKSIQSVIAIVCSFWSVYFRGVYKSSIMTHVIKIGRQCCRLLHRINEPMQLCGEADTWSDIWPGFQLPGSIEFFESQCLKKGIFHTEEDLLKGCTLKMALCYLLSLCYMKLRVKLCHFWLKDGGPSLTLQAYRNISAEVVLYLI